MVSAARAHAVARLPHDGISASDRAPRQSPTLSRGSCGRRRPARERHTGGRVRTSPTTVCWAVRAHARLTGVRALVDRDPPLGRGRRGLGGRDHPLPSLRWPSHSRCPGRSSDLWWLSACACVVLSTYGQRRIEVVATRVTSFGGRSDHAEEARPMMQAVQGSRVQGSERGGVREPR